MGLQVLVVDDATFVRDIIKRTLRKMIPEVELLEAINGKRALALMTANQVDIILSDWEMPEMSGEELLAWVRENPKYLNTPFIMITSRGDRNDVVQAVKTGVSDYLTKPFTVEELEAKILKQLKRINYKKTGQSPSANNTLKQNSGFGSIDVLTGGASKNVAGEIRPGPKKKGL